MKHNPRYITSIWCVSLIFIILNVHTLKGQQIDSAPAITMTSPSVADSLNNSGLARVRADIVTRSALQTFRIWLNGKIVVNETGNKTEQKDNTTFFIERLVPLSRGENIIYIDAKNSFGYAASEKRIITCQPEPFVTWIMPASANSITQSEMLTVKVEIMTNIDLKDISINHNGAIVQVEKGGGPPLNNIYSFEKSIKLKLGKNSIYVTASNNKGAGNSSIRIINYSLNAPPLVNLTNPSLTDTLNNSGLVLVKAQIISKSALQPVRIYNNGIPVVSETGIVIEKEDSITYTVQSLVPLKRGPNIINVEAKNSAGTASSEKRDIICQPEPFVTWIMPASLNSTSEMEMLTIRARIRTELDLKDVGINLNGKVLALEKVGSTPLINNTYNFEKNIKLQPGQNSIYITAANIKGVSNSATRIINYSIGSAPVIALITPTIADSLNNTGLALVSADIVTRFALQTFRIYHNGIMVVNETSPKALQKDSITYFIDRLVPLAGGKNMIYIEAINPVGSSSSEKRVITSQTEPFVKWILPAYINSTSESGMLTVKAEIKSDFDMKNISINLNGTEIAGEKNGITRLNNNTYIFEKSIQLKTVKNSIFIAAGNLRGVTNSTTRIVNYYFGSAPIVTLLSPSNRDSLNNSGVALVNAEIVSKTLLQTIRIFNNRTVVFSGTPEILEQKDSITYIVKNLVPLQSGTNMIYVEAKNYIGTAISDKRQVTCSLEPIIKWILPSSVNSTVESGMLIIKAEIKTNLDLINTTIDFNGVQLAKEKDPVRVNNDTYVFERTVPLIPGANNITLVADNAKGKGYSEKRTISYVPGTISEINWMIPAETKTDTYNPEFHVSATITTKSEIKSTHLSLNGTELSSGDRSKITRKATQEYLFEKTLTLNQGVNTIDLTATTEAGIIGSEKLVITYLAPTIPAIAWKNPVTDQSVMNQPSMEIKLDIKSRAELENISVYLNENPLDNINLVGNVKKENEDFVLSGTITLKPGDNKIYVIAGNVAGVNKSEFRNIKYLVPTMPVIAWRNPETSVSSLSTNVITIKAAITSTTELQNFKLFQNDKLLAGVEDVKAINKQQGDYSIEKTITLNQGENRIYIVAGNSAGNSTSETRSLNYATPSSPEVTWISPSRPYTDINLNSGKIRASIKSTDRLQSLIVYVNGTGTEEVNQILSTGTQGEYTIEKLVNLQPGENSIYLMATNNNGTSKSDLRYLNNPPANPPVISWTNPININAIVNSEIVVIEACIKSATDLKSAKIFVNGVQQASEMMFQPSQSGECNYRLSKSVILKEGDNTIYIIAENFAGSNPPEKRLIRFETATVVEKRLALVIGNSDYGSSNVLKNPVNDANLIEGTLKTLGFNVVKRINATKNEMYEALREFSKKLPEYNVALFYYAGHGVQVDGQNYLIPIDAIMKDPADCKWEAMRVNDVVEEFERVPENINIVILDACRNNPFRSWSRGGAQGFRSINAVTGTIISFATSENSTAADGEGFNGPFTEELVRQINIPQPISSVFMNTRKQVMRRTNNLQRPQESNMLTGEFYFKK